MHVAPLLLVWVALSLCVVRLASNLAARDLRASLLVLGLHCLLRLDDAVVVSVRAAHHGRVPAPVVLAVVAPGLGAHLRHVRLLLLDQGSHKRGG